MPECNANHKKRRKKYLKTDEKHINSDFASQGCVYRFKPLLKDKIVKVLDVLCGDFVAVAPIYTDRSICLVKDLCSVSNLKA